MSLCYGKRIIHILLHSNHNIIIYQPKTVHRNWHFQILQWGTLVLRIIYLLSEKWIGLAGLYFISMLVIISGCITSWVAQILPPLAIGSSSRSAPVPFWDVFAPLFFEHVLTFWSHKTLLADTVFFPTPDLKPAISPETLSSFYGRMLALLVAVRGPVVLKVCVYDVII